LFISITSGRTAMTSHDLADLRLTQINDGAVYGVTIPTSWLGFVCLGHLSLTSDSSPPRITRKSYGPRVPNRTMFAI
jgi:hypothetical protein